MEERLRKLSLGEDQPPPPTQMQSKPKSNTVNMETAVAGPSRPSREPPNCVPRNIHRNNTKIVYNSNIKSKILQQKPEYASSKIRILPRPVTRVDKPKLSPTKSNRQHQQQSDKNGYMKQDQAVQQSPKVGPSKLTDIEKAQRKAAAKEQRLRYKFARRRAEADLIFYLQNTQMTPGALVSKQPNDSFLIDLIHSFMNHLQKRFSDPEISYTDLADKRHEDYAFYGDRLLELIYVLSLPKKVKDNYEQVLEYYQNLHPPSIWRLRCKLLSIKDEVLTIRNQHRQTMAATRLENLDFRMITYKTNDPLSLHEQVCQQPDSEKLKHFIKEISLSDEGFQNLNRFVKALQTALEGSPISALKVKVHPFGSLSNGLATFDSDLDIVLQFNKVLSKEDRLDFETSLLILNIVKTILSLNLDVCRGMPRNVIVPSRRCPIIKIDFKHCFMKDVKKWLMENDDLNINGPLAFNKCDISVTSTYGIYNSRLLKFLTLYDCRFYEMALLLKYWAKKNALICTEGFSSYAFMMLIIFFLQTCKPAILPPICLLQQLAENHPCKFAPITLHGWQFGFADDSTLVRKTVGGQENTQTTEQLIPEFFNFYNNFDYSNMAISTRIGAPTTKEALYAEKKSQGLEMAFKESTVVIEDPFVLEHNPGSIFHSHYMPKWLGTLSKLLNNWNIDEKNVLNLLTDPNRWDPTPPPKNVPEANKEKKAAKAAHADEQKEKKKTFSEQNPKNTQNPVKNETGD